jgi:hypothetical protein
MIVKKCPEQTLARLFQEPEAYLLRAKKTLSHRVISFIKDQILVRIFDQDTEITPYYEKITQNNSKSTQEKVINCWVPN